MSEEGKKWGACVKATEEGQEKMEVGSGGPNRAL